MTTSESRKHYPDPIALEHAELAEYRAEFPILKHKTYMNSCSLGVLPVSLKAYAVEGVSAHVYR